MANTIAVAYGYDKTREKRIQRLGSMCAKAKANTWRTFTECHVNKDGSGYVQVRRDEVVIHRFDFDKEITE